LEYPHVSFLKVDIDISKNTAQSRKISAVPTFHFYKGGTLLQEVRGGILPQIKSALAAFTENKSALAAFTENESRFVNFPLKACTFFQDTGNLSAIDKKIEGLKQGKTAGSK